MFINIRNMSQNFPDKYKGWKVWSLKNHWLKLHIAPQLGGRIIQMEFNHYDFFFVNPGLEGKEPDAKLLNEYGPWLNFGGEKIWPAPQGWDSPEQWPGPPDPVFDGGKYSVTEPGDGNSNQLRLTSMPDQYTGLQIVKDVLLSEDRSEVTVNATFINISDTPREWAVWPVFQMNTLNYSDEKRYRVICPVNPESQFEKGFKEMHGIVNNPQYSVNDFGNLVVDYKYLVGKVGLDSNGNWVAFHDLKSGKVLVTTYEFQDHVSYPEGTSVQIWTQGKGMIYSRNRLKDFPDDFSTNPPYLEIELLSPLYKLLPGESANFQYRILAATIPRDTNVKLVNKTGIIAESLIAEIVGGKIRTRGRFGVFAKGSLKARIFNSESPQETKFEQEIVNEATPFAGILIDRQLDFEYQENNSRYMLALDFYFNNVFSGSLDQTQIC